MTAGTRAALAGLAAELQRLERALATRDGSDVDGGLESLLPDEFLEFGASGRRWDRRATVDVLLTGGSARPLAISNFAIHRLAANTVLATYELAVPSETGARRTLRSSIWQHRDGRWQIVFHQGTPLPEDS